MIDFIRSLPQGVFWYPLVHALMVGLGRLVVAMSRVSQDRPIREKQTSPPGRYVHLVALAQTDAHAQTELERLCVGLLLEAKGHGGYSVDRCHALKNEAIGSELEQALTAHLGEPKTLSTGHGNRRVWSSSAGLPDCG